MTNPILKCLFSKQHWLILLCVANLMFNTSAYAAVALSEQRIVFDDQKRAHALRLQNKGNDLVEFRVTLRDAYMQEDGTIQFAEPESSPHSAAGLLKFSPRQGQLAPGESQVIRFKVSKPYGLKPNEYLSFTRILTRPAQHEGKSDTQLIQQTAYNLPIIVRHGELSAKVWLDAPALTKLADGRWQFSAMLNRSGQLSSSGQLQLIRDQEILQEATGFAIYANISRRQVTLRLDEKPVGLLSLIYRDDTSDTPLVSKIRIQVAAD